MQRRGSVGVVLLMCGSALGQTLVGPSTAVLNGSRFGLWGESSWTDADIHWGGGVKENFDFQTAYAGFAVGLTDRWDFFLRLGGSQAEDAGFDGGMDISWGMGTRITALQWGDFSWGVLGQFTNLVSRADVTAIFDVNHVPTPFAATDELNLVEYVFATGPTWQHGPVSVYGGLLLRYVDGEEQIFAGHHEAQAQVHAHLDAGGYVGGRISLFQIDPARTYWFNRCDLTVEGRFTVDSTGFSIGLLLPFGGAD